MCDNNILMVHGKKVINAQQLDSDWLESNGGKKIYDSLDDVLLLLSSDDVSLQVQLYLYSEFEGLTKEKELTSDGVLSFVPDEFEPADGIEVSLLLSVLFSVLLDEVLSSLPVHVGDCQPSGKVVLFVGLQLQLLIVGQLG